MPASCCTLRFGAKFSVLPSPLSVYGLLNRGGSCLVASHTMPSCISPWRSAGELSRLSALNDENRRQFLPSSASDDGSGNACNLLFMFRLHAILDGFHGIEYSRNPSVLSSSTIHARACGTGLPSIWTHSDVCPRQRAYPSYILLMLNLSYLPLAAAHHQL